MGLKVIRSFYWRPNYEEVAVSVRLHLVLVGKTAEEDLDGAIHRYVKRLQHYVPIEVHLIREEKIRKGVAERLILERESERILDFIKDRGFLLVWDRSGRELNSPDLAALLERLQNQGMGHVWMVVGGALGVSEKLLTRADLVLALSRLTFPHDIARLLVVEQLYRAFTITRGEPYHK
ncbi:MAG TPA: 23S rRNA (pseudouridine(1915)-N(3))-methyltransferase RlmH [Syntrophobacteraceae bacterium]|nr:23S rRNA (pseudouridine(1915)-N(3))-methyltransferase RlmH [Syntrophobacteraceae bacterium]